MKNDVAHICSTQVVCEFFNSIHIFYGSLVIKGLDWTAPEESIEKLSRVDVIIASDVFFDPEVYVEISM